MKDVRCFVVGCPRSGTTLLSVLLDRHSELTIPPETGFYREIAPLVQGAGGEAVRDVLAAWYRLPELGLNADDVVASCAGDFSPGTLLRTILQSYASRYGKPLCGEKSPVHRRYTREIFRDFPTARIVHIVRDGRDVAFSLKSMPWWTSGLPGAVEQWTQAIAAAKRGRSEFPTRFTMVRYEDLARDPEGTLRTTMAFLGLAFERRQLDSSIASHVVLQRSMQWKGRALGRVDATTIGRWKTDASPREREMLTSALGHDLAGLGYA